MRTTRNQTIILSLLCILATIASIYLIDKHVALRIWKFTTSHPFLHKYIYTIPNMLPEIVVIGTVSFIFSYFISSRTNEWDTHNKFFKLAAVSLPTAYLVKIILQYAFGRTNIRMWLLAGIPIEFRWLDPQASGGFPSGHSIVFTSIITAAWLSYPKYRTLAVAALSILAFLLVLTSYHFVSDIIAGIFCGIIITTNIHYYLSKIQSLNRF
jgi:membrane-associated phospholipid phosphatase